MATTTTAITTTETTITTAIPTPTETTARKDKKIPITITNPITKTMDRATKATTQPRKNPAVAKDVARVFASAVPAVAHPVYSAD